MAGPGLPAEMPEVATGLLSVVIDPKIKADGLVNHPAKPVVVDHIPFDSKKGSSVTDSIKFLCG